MKTHVAILAASAVALAAGSAGAGTIFDDGPTDGTVNGFFIAGPNGLAAGNQSIYDTFTATGSGTVGELQVGLWVPTGETPTTFTWWLGTTSLDNSLGGGTVTLSSADYVFHNDSGVGFDVYDVTLTGLSSAMLTAGSTYVLTLGNGNDSLGDEFVAWDNNGGPASCGFFQSGVDLGSCIPGGGEAFTLSTSSVSSAPEPAIWALMLAGFAGLGVALRSRRARPAAA
ncbi:MAG TPA: PEP-CTERM sorting domain-containing protein [Caulobacteraceae bacterium]|jgi:hypothetical protein